MRGIRLRALFSTRHGYGQASRKGVQVTQVRLHKVRTAPPRRSGGAKAKHEQAPECGCIMIVALTTALSRLCVVRVST